MRAIIARLEADVGTGPAPAAAQAASPSGEMSIDRTGGDRVD
jgi:hypothetical protein